MLNDPKCCGQYMIKRYNCLVYYCTICEKEILWEDWVAIHREAEILRLNDMYGKDCTA